MTKPASLRVAIIGGGIAGLAAARILREAHEVTIYEANDPRVSEAGAAVGLGPNGSKMAMALGLSQERVKAVISSGFRVYDQSGTLLKESKIDCGKAFGSDWWMVHRQDLKNALLEAAMGHDPSISSKPAKIIYGSRVEKVNADTGTVFFEDGSQVEADFIIGADGIHSTVRAAVLGLDYPPPTPANLSLYRFTLPRSVVAEILGGIPDILNTDNGTFLSSLIAADGSNRNVVVYPCRNQEVINFACAVPDTMLRHKAEDSWTKEGDVEEMIEHFADFPSWLHIVMGILQGVKLYQLRDADPLPTYTKGVVALIGDAAHPMVPYQGQGANQALEDAEAFKLLLRTEVTKADLPEILKTWDDARRPRASQVQLNSRIAAAKVSPEVIMQRMRFNWTYDGVESLKISED